MRAVSTATSRGGNGRVSGSGEAAALPLACARWRGSLGELVVQRNLGGVKWWMLAMTRAVTGLNGTVAGKAPKLELDVTRVKAGWGRLGRGVKAETRARGIDERCSLSNSP